MPLVEGEELAVREVYLDTVRLDGDEAAARVSQWVWWEIGGGGCLRLLVGRHFDVYVMVDGESIESGQLGKSVVSGRGVKSGGAGPPA